MKTQIINFFKKLRNRLPSPLPVGMTEFEAWASDIINTYGFPDNDSARFTLATQVMHLNATDANKPKHHFYLLTHKGMATQVAYGVMQDLKDKQVKKAEAEQAEANKQAAAAILEGAQASVISLDGQKRG